MHFGMFLKRGGKKKRTLRGRKAPDRASQKMEKDLRLMYKEIHFPLPEQTTDSERDCGLAP